jgi:hypothetical protein
MHPSSRIVVLLVDTSVWIEVFRKPSRLKLDTLADLDEIVTCLPVIQEVLQGFLDERAFRVARDAMFAFPVIESPLKRGLRGSGSTLSDRPPGGADHPFGSRLSDRCLCPPPRVAGPP